MERDCQFGCGRRATTASGLCASCALLAEEETAPSSFGGAPTQAIMESTMDAMVDRSRSVGGKPTSLLDLGYKHVGLDGGWNQCSPENHTFHWASDGRPVWNAAFPDPKAMVDKAHKLGLSPGWCEWSSACSAPRSPPLTRY